MSPNPCRLVVAYALLATAWALATGGCNAHITPTPPKPNPAPVVAGQLGKDATILREADNIDALAPAAKPHTDAQRAAVAAAPAQDVARLTADYEATIKALTAQVAKLTAALADARSATDRAIRISLTVGGALIMGLGIAGAFFLSSLAAIFPQLGPRIIAGIVAFGGILFASGVAYGWAVNHPNTIGIALGIIAVAVAVYWHANHLHAKPTPAVA